MTQTLEYYEAAVAGKSVAIHADDPQMGYYRYRAAKGEPYQLVTVRKIKGELGARVSGPEGFVDKDLDWLLSKWTHIADKVVRREDAQYFITNRRWPGDVDLPAGIGDNSGDLSLMDEIADYMETARSWGQEVDQKSVDKDTADKAANYATHLGTLASKIDKERKDKVAPHLEAQREVNGQYNPIIEEAKKLVKSLKGITGVYLRAEDEKRRKEVAATNIAAEEVAKVKAGGQRGRRVGLKTVVKYECEDDERVLAWALRMYKDHMVDKAIEMATIRMKSGDDVEGMKRVETKEAV